MKKQYKHLIQLSQRISEQLQTLEGRELYWKSLTDEADKYDLTDLLCESLPLEGDIEVVRIAGQSCAISSSSTGQIVCELANPLTAGEWLPEIYTADGLVPIDPLLLKHLEAL